MKTTYHLPRFLQSRTQFEAKMIKSLAALSILAVVLGQEFDFINNIVDYERSPYQQISFPYPHQDNRNSRLINIQGSANNNFEKLPKKLAVLKFPAKLKETKEEIKEAKQEAKPETTIDIKTSVLPVDSSYIGTLCTVASKMFGLAKTSLNHIVESVPALIVGAVLVVGFCKVTSVCTKISSIQSLSEAQKELNSIMTPERIDMMTDFVQEAIRRYRSIQEK